jgi:hypothetical protein
VVQSVYGGVRVEAKIEFPTTDKKMDKDLQRFVSGMGFSLSLESRLMGGTGGPRMVSVYHISETAGGERLYSADVTAANLLKVAEALASKGLVHQNEIREPAPQRAYQPTASETHASEGRLSSVPACMRYL